MELKQRVSEYCSYKRIAVSRFEKMAKLSNGYFNRVTKRPSDEKLDNIKTAFPDLNIEWLIIGEGDMLKKPIATIASSNPKGIAAYPSEKAKTVAKMNQVAAVARQERVKQRLKNNSKLIIDYNTLFATEKKESLKSVEIAADKYLYVKKALADKIKEVEENKKAIAKLKEELKEKEEIIKELKDEVKFYQELATGHLKTISDLTVMMTEMREEMRILKENKLNIG